MCFLLFLVLGVIGFSLFLRLMSSCLELVSLFDVAIEVLYLGSFLVGVW